MKILHFQRCCCHDFVLRYSAIFSFRPNFFLFVYKLLTHKWAIAQAGLAIICLLFSTVVTAQTNPSYTRSYLNNVVEIGLSDFGLITGEDSSNIYFIAVRRSVTEKNASAEVITKTIKKAKFFNNSFQAKATKIKEVRFGAFTIVLYQSPKPPSASWQRNFYHSLSYKKGKLSTFRDKWMSDKIWAVQEAKIEVVKQPKKGVTVIRVPLDAGIAKGMPLVNSDGFISGIFAESTLGKKIVRAINMKDIADTIYKLNKDCHFFNMIEWGKTDTRCVLDELAKQLALEKARIEAEEKAKKDSENLSKKQRKQEDDTTSAISKKRKGQTQKQHFIDYGFNANMLYDPLLTNNPDRNNDFNTKAFHLGLSFHFNIDKKRHYRLTLKPRYGNYTERNDDSLWISPDKDVRIVVTSYKYVEMPVVFERQLFSNAKYSIAVGAGYSPALILDHRYRWWDKSVTGLFTQQVPGTAIMHRLIGEIHFYEFKFGRLTAVYTKDMSGYPHPDYKLSSNGVDYTPFASRKKTWWIGLELGIRLRGNWSRAKP